MKVTVKGQVTIPIAMPERFGLNPGTAVKFVATDGGLRMKPRKRGRKTASAFDHWLAKAAGSARKAVTTDEIMAQTRGGGVFIGAHAEAEGLMLLTREASRYKTYFPKVKLICP